MAIVFRNYDAKPFFAEDYHKVRDFLVRINLDKLTAPNFTWGRWEWMITHGALDHSALNRIGLWETDGKLVALATYESSLGNGYFCVDDEYARLKPEMIRHATEFLHENGNLRILLSDYDREFQHAAASQGFYPTQDREQVAALEIDGRLLYSLPEGFRIVSMADGWDWIQYDRVMWRGFNHEGPPPHTDEDIAIRKQMLSSPTIIPDLVIAVVAPDGSYVSHCGMWYRSGDDYAYVEPVATDPDFRMMGLGKAAVLEAVKRCGKLGARQALVGSSQQFYYNIGFHPIHTETWWELK